jgi:hypothetical protein
MPDERQNGPDEDSDEMPDPGGAPCGDIFGTQDAVYVTDADSIEGDEDD